jgi:general secretion pathway protein A
MVNGGFGLKDTARRPFTKLFGDFTPSADSSSPNDSTNSNAAQSRRVGFSVGAPSNIRSTAGPQLTSGSQQALAQLIQGIEGGKGFLLLTGEAGTGKTTVIGHLRAWLAERSMPVAFLFNPLMDARNLFDYILAEFGVPPGSASSENSFTSLSNWLVARRREGLQAVLIIDEAQGLSTSVLQALGMLLDLESSGDRLLQVVLAGQPEVNDRLRSPELRHIRQRVALYCRTSPLSLDEAQAYLRQRLRTAHPNGESVFSVEALEATHFYSGGIPRVINLLCDQALANASRHGIQPVPAWMIEEAAREFQFDDVRPVALRPAPGQAANLELPSMPVATTMPEIESASLLSGTPAKNGAAAPMLAQSEERQTPQPGAGVLPITPPTEVTGKRPIVIHAAPALRPSPLFSPSVSPVPRNPLPSSAPPRRQGSSAASPWRSSLFALHQQLGALAAQMRLSLSSLMTREFLPRWRAAAIVLRLRLSKHSLPESLRSFSCAGISRDCQRAWGALLHWLKQPAGTPRSRRILPTSK